MKIGLCGLAGSGKDTAAVIIQELLAEQGKHFTIDRYAALLKEAARQVFGETFDDRDVKEESVFVTPDLFDRMTDAVDYLHLKLGLDYTQGELLWEAFDQHIKPLTWISPRLFQQLVGTELGRKVNPNIWVDYLKRKAQDMIVPDVRFDNELLDLNILITRHPVPKGEIHASELFAAELQMMDDPFEYIDYLVWNGEAIAALKDKLRYVLKLNKLIS